MKLLHPVDLELNWGGHCDGYAAEEDALGDTAVDAADKHFHFLQLDQTDWTKNSGLFLVGRS